MTGRPPSGIDQSESLLAYVLPMVVFVLLLGVISLVKQPEAQSLWQTSPEFWIYPLQTLLCAALLVFFRRDYAFGPPRQIFLALGIGLLAFLLWIAPQQFIHFAARRTGFNPEVFAPDPLVYWLTLTLRFVRLVVIVPLVEEIFWRGFLLRFLISEKFQSVPFGSFSWLSFTVVTFAFAFSHALVDWPAALVTGALYNMVAYRTRSLSSCVLTHGLTNLALGLWIVATKQWGFW
jgi:CAAX prenyl protease-like protein